MKRTLYIFALFVLILCLFSSSAFATSSPAIVDQCNSLTVGQKADLEAQISLVESQTGFCVRLFVHDAGRSAAYWGEDYLSDYGFAASDDLLLLIVTRTDDGWFYDLYTYGACDGALSDYEVDALLDHPAVFDNLKSGSIFSGASAFFSLLSEPLLNGEKNGDVPLRYRIGPAIGIAFGVSFIASVVIVILYKRKRRGTSYPLDEFTDLSLTHSADDFIGSSVTKRYVPKSSSSSGGGGSGGGGGHRGGR